MRFSLSLVGFAMALSALTPNATAQSSDMAILNAKVWTGAKGVSPNEPTAIAIANKRIIAVGTDEDIRALIAKTTHVLDAGGRRVIPGITDSHTHIISGGLQFARLHLRNIQNRAAFIDAVARAPKKTPDGEWILGGRWSVESWDNAQPPRATWLDPVTGETPAYLTRMDGHSAVVNSVALKIAGINAKGPLDPVGGEIQRDPKTGVPTGILKDAAMGLVSRHIPQPSDDARYRALLRAMKHANSLGITSVHNMSAFTDLAVFRRASDEGTLTVRITAYLSDDFAQHQDAVAKTHYGLNNDMVRLVGFKAYMDGSMGSRTAYMREPYTDATPDMPHPRGLLDPFAASPESFRSAIAGADHRKLQIAVHAIGDQGNHLLIDAYEEAFRRNGKRDARHRIEHAQHLIPSDIPRFAKLGLVASMQPFHKADDGRYVEKAIGKKRLDGSYAFRKLVDSGALLVFGSDWPVVTLNPFAGIDAAVNAKTLDGKTWLDSHSLSVEEALRAYTVSPPQAVHQEKELGTIEVGKFADLVILHDDVLTIDPNTIANVKAGTTIVAGKVVYRR